MQMIGNAGGSFRRIVGRHAELEIDSLSHFAFDQPIAGKDDENRVYQKQEDHEYCYLLSGKLRKGRTDSIGHRMFLSPHFIPPINGLGDMGVGKEEEAPLVSISRQCLGRKRVGPILPVRSITASCISQATFFV